jgi:hypothetical protein
MFGHVNACLVRLGEISGDSFVNTTACAGLAGCACSNESAHLVLHLDMKS